MVEKNDRIRDEHGKYIDADPIKTETKISTPIPPRDTGTDSSADKPLFSFQINNPFAKFIKWLDYIRKHQTTTFNVKIKIPLIALPVFLVVAFGLFQGFFTLGQYTKKKEIEAIPTPTPIVIIEPTATPAPVSTSKLGVISATYQSPYAIPTVSSATTDAAMNPSPTPEVSRYILVDKDDRVTFLLIPESIDMGKYLGRRVLVNGMYDAPRLTLTIKTASNLELVK